MIASHDRARRRRHAQARSALVTLVLALLAFPPLLACSTRVRPVQTVLDPLPRKTRPLATRGDLAAARLMEAVLGNNPVETSVAQEQLKMTDPHLTGLAQDVVNSALDDPIAYREASQELLDRHDLDPLLEGRLKEEVADDPVALANKRVFDHRHTIFARTFNALVEPVGSSLVTGAALVPYKLALSVASWGMAMWEEDPLTLPERQALTLRKRFIEQHPKSPNAEKIRQQITSAEEDLAKTRERNFHYAARLAMGSNQPRLAELYAARALEVMPDSQRAATIRQVAQLRLAANKGRRQNSVQSQAELPDDLAIDAAQLVSELLHPSLEASLSSTALLSPNIVRMTAEALLLPGSDLAAAADALRLEDPDGELADEADFIAAVGEYESGFETRSWNSFDTMARRDPADSNMARHAAALVNDRHQNPYGSFLHEKKRSRGRFWNHHLFAGSTRIPRYKALPAATGYVLAVPRVVQALAISPMRAIAQGGRSPNFKKGMAMAGYSYLERYPHGVHKDEVVEWLYDYEEKQENWHAALRLADAQPYFDSVLRLELVEKTAGQLTERALEIERRDQRGSLLRRAARDYPDSDAGHAAGETARLEVESDTAQRIRMTRGFLQENPAVAGPSGLGIRAALLDGEFENGELHPRGVSFLGGRIIEVALLDEAGDEEAEPVRIERRISEQRLAQAVAMLDEMSIHNARIDRDYSVEPDPQRDVFFERARLGLTGVTDRRALAQSTYVYRSVRERYGMVRSKESLLPFDLVFRGSVSDLSLGAFPRWREPKQTPDSFLYRN